MSVSDKSSFDGRVIDLSHTVESGMITHPGLPAPLVCDFLSREDSRSRYADGVEFHIGRIDMVANTGTYIDSPFHRYATGKDISELSLSSLVDMDSVVVRVHYSSARSVTAAMLHGLDVRGKAVLVNSGWDSLWQQPGYIDTDNSHLTEDAANYLLDNGAALVGIDSVNIDSLKDNRRPVHTILLGRGIPIVEHLCNLDEVETGARFYAAPVAVRGIGTFPVRAYAIQKN